MVRSPLSALSPPGPRPRRFARLLAGTVLATVVGSTLAAPAQPAAASPLAELITNGTFSTGSTASWWNSQHTSFQVVAGQLCVNVAGGTTNVYDALVGQSGITLTNGKAYALAFDVSASAPVHIRTRVQLEAAPQTPTLDQGVQADAGLRRISVPFTSSIGTSSGQVVFQLGGRPQAVTVCLDNISLIETELVGNGTFNSTTAPWWRSNTATQLGVDGQRLRVSAGSATAQPWDDIVGLSGLTLRAGRSYRIQFDASASAARSVQAIVQREAAPYTAPFSRGINLTTTSQHFSFTFTSPLAANDAQVIFNLGGGPAFTAWLDNVSLVELTAAPFDPVRYWNGVLLDAYRAATGTAAGPTVLSRAGAMMHGAIYDAATSVVPTGQPYLVRVPVTADAVAPSLEAAINKAAHSTLVAAFPGRSFTANLNHATAQLPTGTSQLQLDRGASIGAQAADAMIQARSNDGSANNTPYQLDNVPGSWRPTDSRPALAPNWGLVTPFAMTSGAQFRPPAPLGATSYADLLSKPEYGVQLNEVKELGARNSTTRTATQTQIAHFWANDLDGTYKPPGQLLDHTTILSVQRGLTVMENARLYGLVGLALGDAGIVARDGKFLTNIDLWRPETAIQRAHEDGRPETVADANWRPLSKDLAGVSFSPPFPAYASGHATFGGAWAGIMRLYFGTDNLAFTATTDDPYASGVTRSFTSFSQAAIENGISRIYLGVHFRIDADAGVASGNALAEYIFANRLRP
ncbi:carbohydrate binding domain-containing protein [Micromonospora craterilacus]|uniref:carbohydrate binding domain-containing protein n=1 Tax=Micromonospora craterilacus TaxID=1655439 RepID=UPI001314912B|nr:carbohydrate binding domain-containing protein [Micromonospora craterilacus]